MIPASLRIVRCLETVDMSAPINSVSSQTQRSPQRDNSSTMNSRVGWAMALMISDPASYSVLGLHALPSRLKLPCQIIGRDSRLAF